MKMINIQAKIFKYHFWLYLSTNFLCLCLLNIADFSDINKTNFMQVIRFYFKI